MGYCNQCGELLNEIKSFCPSCGNVVSEKTKHHQKLERKRQSSVNKLPFLLPLGLAIIGVLVSSFFITEPTSKEEVVQVFLNGITDGDTTEILKHIKTNDKRIQLDDKSLQPLLTYVNKHPSSYIEIEEEINRQLEGGGDNHKDYMFTLEKNKEGLFLSQYAIILKLFFIDAKVKGENSVVFVNEEKVGKTSMDITEVELGPYLPGSYKIEAYREENFVTIMAEEIIQLWGDDENNIELNLDLTGEFMEVTTNYDGIRLYANGKDTG